MAAAYVGNTLGGGNIDHFKNREVDSVEFLEPRFSFVIWLEFRLGAGVSVRNAMHEYVNMETSNRQAKRFRAALKRWVEGRQDEELARILSLNRSVMTLTLLETLQRGLAGEPIRETIGGLKEEMEFATRMAIENHLQRLPVLVLGPLMLLIFPAIMIVMIGPIVLRLLEEMGA